MGSQRVGHDWATKLNFERVHQFTGANIFLSKEISCCCCCVVFFFLFLSSILCGVVLVTKSCLTLWDPMDCSLPGASVHGISQARILEWIAISFSRGSSYEVCQFLSGACSLAPSGVCLWYCKFSGAVSSCSTYSVVPDIWALLVPSLLWVSKARNQSLGLPPEKLKHWTYVLLSSSQRRNWKLHFILIASCACLGRGLMWFQWSGFFFLVSVQLFLAFSFLGCYDFLTGLWSSLKHCFELFIVVNLCICVFLLHHLAVTSWVGTCLHK